MEEKKTFKYAQNKRVQRGMQAAPAWKDRMVLPKFDLKCYLKTEA